MADAVALAARRTLRVYFDDPLPGFGTAAMARLVGVPLPTFTARLMNGGALCREVLPEGRQRAGRLYTGRDALVNVIADRMMRYGVAGGGEATLPSEGKLSADWEVRDLSAGGAVSIAAHAIAWAEARGLVDDPEPREAVLVVEVTHGGEARFSLLDFGPRDRPDVKFGLGSITGDAVIFLHLSYVVATLALRLFAKIAPDDLVRLAGGRRE